jgi:electron transfer flavoprotein alpha subunit
MAAAMDQADGRILVVGEMTADGGLARISTEVATLARGLATAAGREILGVVVGADPGAAADELARYLPSVVAVTDPAAKDHATASIVAERAAALAGQHGVSHVLVGATPDGRDTAGVLSALLGWGVLANASAVSNDDGSGGGGGLTVEMSVLGGALVTRSSFTTPNGIVTVRPNVVTAEPAETPGTVDPVAPAEPLRLPLVAVTGRAAEESGRVPIEEARIIVAGGRGVGGPEGFALVEELAGELGGSIGATRAAVDSGWIDYAQQIGQTGKTVKPQLYLALGISGAIQHKVGMQTAETIVAINRDPDAPLAEFADLYVVGDLFDVVPALLAELRSRAG